MEPKWNHYQCQPFSLLFWRIPQRLLSAASEILADAASEHWQGSRLLPVGLRGGGGVLMGCIRRRRGELLMHRSGSLHAAFSLECPQVAHNVQQWIEALHLLEEAPYTANDS